MQRFSYLSCFGAFVVAAPFFYCIGYVIYVHGQVRASKTIHKWLIDSVTGATLRYVDGHSSTYLLNLLVLRWLDSTPTGRIITRCTQDIRSGKILTL